LAITPAFICDLFGQLTDCQINDNEETESFGGRIMGYTVAIPGNVNTHLYHHAEAGAQGDRKFDPALSLYLIRQKTVC